MASDFKKKIISCCEPYKKTLLLLMLLFVLYIVKRGFCIVIIFTLFDFAKTILKVKFHFVPVDLCFIFGITAAYFFNPFYSLVILGIGYFNRFIFGFIETRHLSSLLRETVLFFLVVLFRNFSFIGCAVIMLVLKYVLKFGQDLILYRRLTLEDYPFFIANSIISYIMFYLIDSMSFLL